MVSALTVLHLITNPILALPLVQLARPPLPPAEDELPGIRPIKVRVITPRRGLILTLLTALAFTSVLDAAILVVDLLSGPHHPIEWYEDLKLVSWVVYTFGGFLVWALAAILAEWRTKWGDKSMAVMAATGLVLEITNLPFLVIREIHTGGSRKIFTILSIPPSCLRILLLFTLVVAVSNPRVSFEDATESTGLLNGNGEDESEAGPSRGRAAYGTFEETGTPKPSSRGTWQQPGTATSGHQTPTPGGPAKSPAKITIPKKLGEKKEEDKPMTWKEFWPRLKKLSPHLWPSTSVRLQVYCLACIGIVIAGRFLIPLVPITLGRVVRALSRSHGDIFGPSVWPPFITYFGIRAIMTGGLLDFVRQYLWVPVYQYTDREMMLLCFNHLLNLSLAYHTKRNTGEVMRIIDRGSAINNLFQTLLFTAIPTVIDIIVAAGVLYYLYGPTIALVTLATMVIYITVSFSMTRSRVRFRRELMDRDVKQRGIVNDVLTNWESVKYFTAEHRERDRFREAVVSYQETEAKWTITYSLLNLIQTFLLTLGLMLGSMIIVFRVIRGRADAAEFVVFLQYFQQLSRPLDNLGSLYRSLNTNTTDAEKMFNLLAQATEVNDKPGAKDLVVTDGIIEFKDVRFSYNDKVEALKGVSFSIGKGQSMALVGESGSGKSTILRLLYRFYDIDSGTILIDGQDISQVTQLSLRRAIGIVPQDSVLWNDTIGANVGYGKEDATDEEIIEAALAAKLHDRILSFPEQYSTVVGERGVRLSGGEKQRVSLARMFLKSPAILVLDEATSALDTETEREIQRALADLAKGRSSLSIAHRLSTIINSDQIVVMKDGQIVEHGAYKELLDLNGAFAAMWKKQIHTDAEMVAQAEGEGIIEAAPDVKLVDGANESDGLPTGKTADSQSEDESARAGYDLKAQTSSDAPQTPSTVTNDDIQPQEESDQATAVDEDAADDTPATYADAVKHHYHEATIPEEHEPGSPDTARGTTVPPPQTAEAAAASESESATLLNKGKGRSTSPSAPPTPTPATPPASTPAKSRPTSFPVMPRQVSSTSQRSVHSSPSGASTPSRSTSYPNLAQSTSNSSQGHGQGAAGQGTPTDEKEKGGKARKRLNSIKGFVRRISDQGAGGLSRSNSTGRHGGLASPEAGTPEGGAANRNKRLSMPPRGKSNQD